MRIPTARTCDEYGTESAGLSARESSRVLAKNLLSMLRWKPANCSASPGQQEFKLGMQRSGRGVQDTSSTAVARADGNSSAFPKQHADAAPGRPAAAPVDVGPFKDGARTFPAVSAFEERGSIDASVVAGIAHDINNVLTVVRLHVDFVLSGPLTCAQQSELGAAIQATIRGAALMKQMVRQARHQAGESLICDLNGIVSNTVESLGRVIGSEIALVTELSSSSNRVRSGAGQIDRILLNLVFNARDAMPRGGTLTVTVQQAVIAPGLELAEEMPPGRYATLSVQDTGLGMSPELQGSIFDPFFTTKSAHGGTGLGLPIVLQQVRELRGAVRVESELGKGSTFTIYLPLVVETGRAQLDGQ